MDNEAWMCDADEAGPTSSPLGLQEPFCPFFGASHVLVTQLCPTLCDAMGFSPPGPSIPGILQARVLEWDAISFYIWHAIVGSTSSIFCRCPARCAFPSLPTTTALPASSPQPPQSHQHLSGIHSLRSL